jgi:DNA repair photolyase
MIISTGMRTDIPAFYSKWFINRIREGYVCTRNPYNESQVTKYILDEKVVDCICFCTKNPIPMLQYMDEIKKFRQFWFVTITPYGRDIEPNVPPKEKIIEAFKTLSTALGKFGVAWRYDPVFYGAGWTREKHIAEFEKMAKALSGYTDTCVVSILDLYNKVKRNAPEIYPPEKQEQLVLLKEFVRIGRENGIKIKSCYEGTHLSAVGVDCSGCQTQADIERAIGVKLNVPARKNARGECNCLLGNDIGIYNSCGHLCKYCYANADRNTVLANMRRHSDTSPFLIGGNQPGDKVTTATQKSFIDGQMRLF